MKKFPRLSSAQLSKFAKLSQKKFRREEGLFVAEGPHLIDEALKSDWEIQALLLSPAFIGSPGADEIVGTAGKRGIRLFEVSDRELTKIGDTVTTQGIAGIVARKEYVLDEVVSGTKHLVVALEDITDPGNVGSIIRTCSWFGVDAVLLNRGSVELYNPKVLRSTMGALFHLPVVEDVDLPSAVPAMKSAGYSVASGVLGAPNGLEAIKGREQRGHEGLLLIFGNESRGVSAEIQKISNLRFSIPGFGNAESLNVAAAAAVVVGTVKMGKS